ncbi:MAG: DNA repair protein RadC [Oscillospiraceae bacterium]|jgi:DNA repair protein RadC|nr:DNA repair protein RadC [Oscillospiraceae bacterium]
MKDNIHDGHRRRLRKRYAEFGLDSFEDHTVLELLLTYAVPRRDVNELAHRLVDKFGSLGEVFDAPVEELMKTEGVGESTALLIRMVPEISRRSMISKNEKRSAAVLSGAKESGKFFIPYFYGECEEAVYAAFLDDSLRLISCRLMMRGEVNEADLSSRKLVSMALSCRATNVVLAHNHPSGSLIPSAADRQATAEARNALKAVDINLVDHVIISGNMYVSMEECGYFMQRENNGRIQGGK